MGRFFFDHLHIPVARLHVSDGGFPSCYTTRDVRGTAVRGAVSFTRESTVREKLFGFGVTFHNAKDPHDIFSLAQVSESYDSLRYLVKTLARGERPDRPLHHAASVIGGLDEIAMVAWRKLVKPSRSELVAGCRAEQAPNRDSRVTLDESTDALGGHKARLDWRIADEDLDQLERAQLLLLRELATMAGIDLMKTPRHGEHGWAANIAGGAHHMGTTRMHRDPRLGVVDENCRIHGTSNVFVAGSSVFPTGGWAPPTLTIVALALRLADHLTAEQ